MGIGLDKADRKVLLDPLFNNNPIALQVLGICSALAVTTKLDTAVTMCIALTFVTAFSNLSVSIIRNHIPHTIRMIVQMTIIASLVIVVDQVLRAYMFDISKRLSVFVGLIITNCIVMGRCEAFGNSNPPGRAFLDGAFSALGYSFVLLIIATFREVLGMGTFAGLAVPFFSGPAWDKWIIMVMPPGAFFMLAVVIWVFRSIQIGQEAKSK